MKPGTQSLILSGNPPAILIREIPHTEGAKTQSYDWKTHFIINTLSTFSTLFVLFLNEKLLSILIEMNDE